MYNDTAMPVVKTLSELQGLVQNLLLLLSDKEKVVIKKRFALDGKGRFTLEQIGQEFAVTRERIRQIEKNALSKMRRNVFNTSLRSLHDFVLNLVRQHGGLFKKDALFQDLVTLLPQSDEGVFDFSSLDLSLMLHDDLECVGNTINFYPYVKEKALPDDALKTASDQLVHQLQKYGDVESLAKVHADLKDKLSDLNFDLVKIKSLIEIDKRLTLLPDGGVALLMWRHIHPRTLRDKILFVLRNEKKPMHFMQIAERISNSGFDNRSVNLQAVHNELIRHENFVLIGRGIYALAEWGYERGTVAEVIEKILTEMGELSQDDIIDQVLKKRDVKKITIVLALKNNKQFVRVGRKQYKLKS